MLSPLENISGATSLGECLLFNVMLPLVNSFLPVRIKGRICYSELQYSEDIFQGFLRKSNRLNFSWQYVGILTYFYLLIFVWFPGMESHQIKVITKAIINLCTLSIYYSFTFLSAILSPFLMHLDVIFHFKACLQNHAFLSISFLLKNV